MRLISLLVLMAGALSALAGIPFALAGDSLARPRPPMVPAPSLALQTCQADEVVGKHWNMTWLPAFFSSLVAPSLAADASSPFPCGDKTIDLYMSKTTGLGRADSPLARMGAANETMPSIEPATSTQRLETGAAGLGVIALAAVLWL